jgi:hypothetical protein
MVILNVTFGTHISSKSKNVVKENSEYLGLFHLLK